MVYHINWKGDIILAVFGFEYSAIILTSLRHHFIIGRHFIIGGTRVHCLTGAYIILKINIIFFKSNLLVPVQSNNCHSHHSSHRRMIFRSIRLGWISYPSDLQSDWKLEQVAHYISLHCQDCHLWLFRLPYKLFVTGIAGGQISHVFSDPPQKKITIHTSH